MLGTIGRFRVKPGHEERVRALNEEWARDIRPTIPGLVVELWGRPVGAPGEQVAVVLMQDEATYRALAARPEQDAWYRRLVEHLEAEPSWEDVAWDAVRAEAGQGGRD
jgi:hypothetical protein